MAKQTLLIVLCGLALAACSSGGGGGDGSGPIAAPQASHPHIELLDALGRQLTADSTEPYSPRLTCGRCHNYTRISRAYHFQNGRTDTRGNVVMKDDYFGDGRDWLKSAGMYGKWCAPSADSGQLAGKDNVEPSEIDKTTFSWVGLCGICHAGGDCISCHHR